MLYHIFTHFKFDNLDSEFYKKLIYHFPGVPVFFTISGFLIYQSLERNSSNLKKYFRNRLLRIYPALWICLIFTIILLFNSNIFHFESLFNINFWKWFLAQLTLFQSYKLPEMESWGVGHPNGSLWSISVEIQFYLFLPILFWLFIKNQIENNIIKTIIVLMIFLLSFTYSFIIHKIDNLDHLTSRLMDSILLNYLYFFCFGILIKINFERFKSFINNKAAYWFLAYCIYIYLFQSTLSLFENVHDLSIFGLIGQLILSILTISFAYSWPTLSNRLIGENDVSYGIYIYHMPIINHFINFEQQISIMKLLLICFLILFTAYLSWHLVEKRILKFK
jgi:peptidoglycan/LPS O-acetylase OafA/YrhL